MRRRRVQSHDVTSSTTTRGATTEDDEVERLFMQRSSSERALLEQMSLPPTPHRFNQLRCSISAGSTTTPPPTSSSRGRDQMKADNSSIRDRSASRTSASGTKPLDDFSLTYHVSVIYKQSIALAKMLIHGTPIWMVKVVRLMAFVIALIPAFTVTVWYYFVTGDRIAVSYIPSSSTKIANANNPEEETKTTERTSRHYLDIYGTLIPSTQKKPVLIFLTGGAWIIGYKAWGTLMARVLSEFGILVIIPDYRNFPQSNVSGMLEDVDRAIEFVLKHAQEYGGDPTKVVIAGQSAGAHLGACILLQKSQHEKPLQTPKKTAAAAAVATETSWHASDIQGFIAVSGPYDLVSMRGILHQHGLDKSIVNAMFGHDLQKYSPTLLVKELLAEEKEEDEKQVTTTSALLPERRRFVQKYFPKTSIIHGQSDKTVPYQISIEFYEALQHLLLPRAAQQLHGSNHGSSNDAAAAAAASATKDGEENNPNPPPPFLQFKLYPTWSHTDPILEAPFAGNHLFHKDVYDLVQLWTSTTPTSTASADATTSDKTNGINKEEGGEQEVVSCLLPPFDEGNPACAKICPLTLVQVARFCNPF